MSDHINQAAALPPLPANVAHVTRRIRRCESDVAAQVVLEHFAIEYAKLAIAADRAQLAQQGHGEPTTDMIRAGMRHFHAERDPATKAYRCYKDMVAAAPASAQPARYITEDTAQAYMEETLWAFIECAGNFPSVKTDSRIWPHVMVYAAPQPAARVAVPDERVLMSMFQRDAEKHLGSPMVACAPGFQKDDDGGYQYANTRRLFDFWKAARAASPATVACDKPVTEPAVQQVPEDTARALRQMEIERDAARAAVKEYCTRIARLEARVLAAGSAAQQAAPTDAEIIDVLWDATGRGWKPSTMPEAADKIGFIFEWRQIIAAFRVLLSRTPGAKQAVGLTVKSFELVDCGTCGCQVSLPVEYAAPASAQPAQQPAARVAVPDGYLNDDCDAPMANGSCTECGFGPCRRASPVTVTSPAQDEARADEIVTALYRRFKDWSKRGFGPDDVTWCEVKADVLNLIATVTEPAAQQAAPTEPVDEKWAIYYDNLGKQPYESGFMQPWKLYDSERDALEFEHITAPEHYKPRKVFIYAAPATAGMVGQDAKDAALQRCGWMYIDDDGHGPFYCESERNAKRYLHHWAVFKRAPADGHICDYRLAYGCCSQCRALEDTALAAQQAQASAKEGDQQ